MEESILYYLLFLFVGVWIVSYIWGRLSPGKSLKGKRVLITGSGMGIGRLMALGFAKEGAKLVLWDIRTEGISSVAKEIAEMGGEVNFYQCDVSNRDMVYEIAAKVKKEVGQIDILVNNAGIVGGKPFLELKDEMIQRTFEVNTLSHFWMLKAFLPDMIQRDSGHIVTIASVMGWVGSAGLTDYSASKFAVVGFHESLQMELRRLGSRNISTTLVCPYGIKTGMFNGLQTGFQMIYPLLEPDYVASETVRAVKKDRLLLMLPPQVSWTLVILRCLPVTVANILMSQMGGTTGMDRFTGRGENFSLLKLDRKKEN